MAPNKKITPNLDHDTTKLLNLKILQRMDPCVEEILMTVAHVTSYTFNIDTNEWSRRDVEGSLFVVKRSTQPRYQFIVMNRRSTENLVENLLGDFEYEVQVPYLLYRNAALEVIGIWFYNSSECENVANLFSSILNAYYVVSPEAKVSPTKSDYDAKGAVPPLSGTERPFEPSLSSASSGTNIQGDSPFVNFFNAATGMGNTSNATKPRQLHQTHAAIPPSSHSPNLLSNPVPASQAPFTRLISPAKSLLLLDTSDKSICNSSTSLLTPSVFLTSPLSTMMPLNPPSKPTAPLQRPLSLHRPYGAPVLQPFPPPTPPPSLTPTTTNNGPLITRDKVRDTLMKLVQNSQFIDMFYEELMKGAS